MSLGNYWSWNFLFYIEVDAMTCNELNFFQVTEQTDEEKLKMYMKLPKKKLAEMLIESNRAIKISTPFTEIVIPQLSEWRIKYGMF